MARQAGPPRESSGVAAAISHTYSYHACPFQTDGAQLALEGKEQRGVCGGAINDAKVTTEGA